MSDWPDELAWLSFEDWKQLVFYIGVASARMAGFFSIAPIFASRAMPRNVRVGVILALTIVLVPSFDSELAKWEHESAYSVYILIKEVVIGIILGMLVWLPLRGVEFSGVLLDTQRGNTTAQDYDVIFNAQTTPTAIFLSQTLAAYFFAFGGFILVCHALFESYEAWPIFDPLPRLDIDQITLFLKIAGKLLLVSVVFALPISLFMFLADLGIAFVAKTSPTLNALTFSMPVKSAISLIMLFLYMQMAFPAVMAHFESVLPMIDRVLRDER